jgi:hypothetical protein
MGIVTEEEAAKIADTASRVRGVRRVIRAFEVVTGAQLADISMRNRSADTGFNSDYVAGGSSPSPEAQNSGQTSAAGFLVVPPSLPACEGRDVSQWTNCFGTYTRPSGAIYVGEFKNGKPDGQGSLTYPSALRSGAPPSKYVGEFKDGDFNGQGIHTYEIGFGRTDSIGRTEEGLWQNGQFVQSQRIPEFFFVA